MKLREYFFTIYRVNTAKTEMEANRAAYVDPLTKVVASVMNDKKKEIQFGMIAMCFLVVKSFVCPDLFPFSS